MVCPSCGKAAGFRGGRCVSCGASEHAAAPARAPSNCPKCQSPLGPEEYFCAKCGHQLQRTPEDLRRIRERWRAGVERARHRQRVGKGRGWILAVSILTLLGGLHNSWVVANEAMGLLPGSPGV